ncbi:MAG TPA: DUF2085 domain-containing protein [Roseiflexaceae bacterium]|nr:DUF2085 domain-containing protein [Roseiflexaceae bacterium]
MADTTFSPALQRRLDDGLRWGLRHWLSLVNGGAIVYAGLPWLSPLAKAGGHPLIGELLFRLYTPLCHQLPERSFFICGHQVAFCHRCAAMYTAIVVAGLLFGLLRRRIRPVSLKVGGLLLLPILIDGLSHMIDDLTGLGFRGGGDAIGTPNFWLRMITGALVGIVVLLAIYPRIQRDLRDQVVPPARPYDSLHEV